MSTFPTTLKQTQTMRTIITLFLMAGSAFSSAQDPRIENLWKLYGAGQREEAIAQATALRSADVDQAAVSLLLGRANADEGK
jgi:hypothetical protein